MIFMKTAGFQILCIKPAIRFVKSKVLSAQYMRQLTELLSTAKGFRNQF